MNSKEHPRFAAVAQGMQSRGGVFGPSNSYKRQWSKANVDLLNAALWENAAGVERLMGEALSNPEIANPGGWLVSRLREGKHLETRTITPSQAESSVPTMQLQAAVAERASAPELGQLLKNSGVAHLERSAASQG